MKPRVRIAPSPTGYLHIGTARAALFNYLFAKKHGGDFIVRIEDTDLERSDKKFTQDILDGLQWLGLTWDEGPDRGGAYGPYLQSARTSTYTQALRELSEAGKIYECFCTPDELERERIAQAKNKQSPKYSGRCAHLTDAERERKRGEGRTSILRFHTPAKTVEFTDLIRGSVSFHSALLGDFSIARNMETPLYNFAVVVDDETMKITHVIRGEDHLSNTPKQILLIEALGYGLPQYAHLPLILNADRTKLSKRKNKVSMNDFRDAGYLPEAMLNFMAFLGWNPKTEQELFSLDELVNEFDLSKVNASGSVFDAEKLNWMNGQYIRRMDFEELFRKTEPFFTKEMWKRRRKKILRVQQARMRTLKDVQSDAEYFVRLPEYLKERLLWKNMPLEKAKESLDIAKEVCATADGEYESPGEMEAYLKAVVSGRNLKAGEFFWPLRVALTGRERSHSPFEMAYVLGKKETLNRIDHAIALFVEKGKV